MFVVRFAGVDSRDAAEALVGQTLMVPADDRPELEEGEFHLLDLVGLEARLSADGEAIGSVSDLISGGNELLEIKTPDGRTPDGAVRGGDRAGSAPQRRAGRCSPHRRGCWSRGEESNLGCCF